MVSVRRCLGRRAVLERRTLEQTILNCVEKSCHVHHQLTRSKGWTWPPIQRATSDVTPPKQLILTRSRRHVASRLARPLHTLRVRCESTALTRLRRQSLHARVTITGLLHLRSSPTATITAHGVYIFPALSSQIFFGLCLSASPTLSATLLPPPPPARELYSHIILNHIYQTARSLVIHQQPHTTHHLQQQRPIHQPPNEHPPCLNAANASTPKSWPAPSAGVPVGSVAQVQAAMEVR